MKKILVLVLIVAVIALASYVGAAGDSIKIGGNYEVTGGQATFGTSCVNATKLLFEDINSKGGVLGRQLELVVADNKSDPAEAASMAKKLISQDKVVAILGPVTSSNALSAGPIAQEAKIPLITPTATNIKVTQVGDYIFRACFIDDFQGVVMSNFAVNSLKLKTAAIFVDSSSDYSKGLATVFKENFTKHGGKIVAEEAYIQKDKDFRTQLTKFKMQNPGMIYCPGYYEEDGLVAKQARELGMNMPILGGDGWDSAELVQIAGDSALNNIFFSNHYSPESKDPKTVQFVKDYLATYKEKPDALAALGYDAALVISEAIKTAKSTDPAKIRAAIVRNIVKGVSGVIKYDPNRNPVKSAVVIQLKNGVQTYYSTVNP